tara:strand:- start:1597 stop:2568 length:972 start_codon:yes stop_codon:yes gene_type:complete
MKIILTGISGFVGSLLSKKLKELNHEVIGLDKINPKHDNFDHFIKVDLIEFNLTELILKKLKNSKLIIHCAAAKGDFMLTSKDFFNDNVLVTETIKIISQRIKCNNIIHYSTVSVYGHNNKLKDENCILNPNNAYGATKLQSEKILIKWQKIDSKNRNLNILRPSVIYGENNYANMFNLINQLNKKYPISIGKGNYIKSMIAVENIVQITIFLINKLNGIKIFNCIDKPYVNLSEVINYICEIKGFNKPIIKIPFILAYILSIPFELFSYFLRKDFGINRDRVYKYNTPTDFRSEKLFSMGYIQKYKTKERIQNMAKWYLNIK